MDYGAIRTALHRGRVAYEEAMIERMPKGWPYERLKSRDDAGFSVVAGVFAIAVMVTAIALAMMGAW